MAEEPKLDSWLIRTHQKWKLTFMFLAALIGAGAWFASFVFSEHSQVMEWIGEGLMLLGLLFGVVAIRCERCGERVLLHYLKVSSFTRWLFDLREAQVCPVCGK